MPFTGSNLQSHVNLMSLSGRSYVTTKVRTAIQNVNKLLAMQNSTHPIDGGDEVFTSLVAVNERAQKSQSGLSVDFLVPLVDASGASVAPNHSLVETNDGIFDFDSMGQFLEYRIDFELMAKHLAFLHREASQLGLGLWRVVFNPKLQHHLINSAQGAYLIKHLRFSRRQSPFQCDAKYHVDFEVPRRIPDPYTP